MPKITEMITKASELEKVDAYMGRLKHPLAMVVEDLRQIILSTDKEIGEEIKWNAPAFFYAGNETDESEGVPTLYRGIQFVQAGLHPFGISEWSEGQRCVRVTGRRLSGWKKTCDVLQLEGREVQGEVFAHRYHQMAKIVGEIVPFETLRAPA